MMNNCDIFKDGEKDILDVAYLTFITKQYILKKYVEKWPSAGFEAWVTGELLIQFEIRRMNPKKTQDPDLTINNLKIEVKGNAHSINARSAGWLIEDYIKHPNKDILHLWVFSKAKILNHIEAFFLRNNIVENFD